MESDLSQKQMAELYGISQQTVSDIVHLKPKLLRIKGYDIAHGGEKLSSRKSMKVSIKGKLEKSLASSAGVHVVGGTNLHVQWFCGHISRVIHQLNCSKLLR